MVGYIENGYIEPYVPEGMQYMSPGFYDPEGYWFAIDNGPYVIVYNTRFVSPEEAPKTWADLLDPSGRTPSGLSIRARLPVFKRPSACGRIIWRSALASPSAGTSSQKWRS